MSKYRTIGILGGMGPEATAELYKRIIRIYQTERGAVDDADFPNILINSVPVSDMLNDLANSGSVIAGQLQQAAQVLENAGAEFIAVPCNTATTFFEEMKQSVSVPIIDITEVTAKQVQKLGSKKVGILASSSTIETKIYENKFNRLDIPMLKPGMQGQREVNQIIMRILAGQKTKNDRQALQVLTDQMISRGADCVILGCTELPLLMATGFKRQLINTLQVLAEAIVYAADLNKQGDTNENPKF